MPAYSNSDSRFDTNAAGTSGTLANLAPLTVAAGDLSLVVVGVTGSTTHPTVTDDSADGQGGSWAEVLSALKNVSTDVQCVFVRNARFGVGGGVTFTAAFPACTGVFIAIINVSGMLRAGLSAIRTTGKEQNQTTGGPQPSLDLVPLGGNFLMSGMSTNLNSPSIPAPTGWTSRINGGYLTPTTGAEIVTVDNGWTTQAVFWNGSAGNVYSDFAIELDSSPDPVAAAATTPFPPLGRGASW